jgi:hypothetical protein
MKRCENCGAVQDDSRSTCIDCGAALPKPMTDAEMAAHEEALGDTLYNMAEKTETFFVPRWARILGIASIVCFVGALLFLLLAPNRQYAQAGWVCTALFCPVAAAPLLLFPRFVWWMETIGKRWWFEGGERLQPSFAYITVTRCVGVVCAIVAMIGFVALMTTAV